MNSYPAACGGVVDYKQSLVSLILINQLFINIFFPEAKIASRISQDNMIEYFNLHQVSGFYK